MNGAVTCSSCDEGYFLNGILCEENTCSCTDGTGATGTDCPADGDVKCVSCDAGFTLENDACVVPVPEISSCLTMVNPPETDRSYSTVWGNDAIGTGHARSMLGSDQAWTAGWNAEGNYAGEWMEIDLGSAQFVGGVAVQGRRGNGQWVPSFTIEYYDEDTTTCASLEESRVFTVPSNKNGNDANDHHQIRFGAAVFTSRIRIVIVT